MGTPPVSGPEYGGPQELDDEQLNTMLLESQSTRLQPRPAVGTLATLIRDAKAKGLIAPVRSGYQSA